MKVEFVNLKEVDDYLQVDVRNWRNAEHVTRFFQIPYINEETHKQWLLSLKEDKPRNIAFLIKANDQFVGLSYFLKIDYCHRVGEWGMYISDENFRGKGVGTKVLKWSMNEALNHIGLNKVILQVQKDNVNAIRLYEKNNFQVFAKINEILHYEVNL